MSIFVIGFNHQTAAITLREKGYFPIGKLPLYLQDLLQQGQVREAVLLSTCNRSELYCETDDVVAARAWFIQQTQLSATELNASIYIHQDQEAITHIMQVACGLDSMVLGESQILGQMKEAFAESCTAGAVNTLFYRLFQQVFSVAKEIRATTAIGACPVSVASAAVHFAKQVHANFANATIALIGAGDTSELLLRYLHTHLQQPIMIINRSMKNAISLAEQYQAEAYHFESLVSVLAKADIVFSATGSPVPIVNETLMQKVALKRGEKSITLIDLAVPRDIEPGVATRPNVSLYCVDDLMRIIESNRQGREHAAEKARELIKRKSAEFMQELIAYDKVTHTIRVYRNQIEEICDLELTKAKQQLSRGMAPSQVLDLFAHAFTKKLLHSPSVQLRQAGAQGRFEVLSFAKQLFAIPDGEASDHETIN